MIPDNTAIREKFAVMAKDEFESYLTYLDLHWVGWDCEVNELSEGFKVAWKSHIVVPNSKAPDSHIDIPTSGVFYFKEDATKFHFRQMYAMVIGVQLHPRSPMFNWILEQEQAYRLQDPDHDNILEVVLRSVLTSMILSGVRRPEILGAFLEQCHFDYNVARTVDIMTKGKRLKRH
jgi:hypothetical protein